MELAPSKTVWIGSCLMSRRLGVSQSWKGRVSVDLELAAPGKQMTETLPSVSRPPSVPDVCAQAIWDYRPGL